MLEFYEAYGNLEKTTNFIQKLVQDSVLEVNNSLKIQYDGKPLDLSKNFKVTCKGKQKLGIEKLESSKKF